MAAADELQRLGLAVGWVVAAEDHPGARAPSYRLTVDLGGGETREATVALPGLAKDELVGRQVVCVTAEEELLVLEDGSIVS